MASSRRGRRRKQRRKRWINRVRVWWPVAFVGIIVAPLYLLAANSIGYVAAFLLVLGVSVLGAIVMGAVLLYVWVVESLTTKKRTQRSEVVVDEASSCAVRYVHETPTPAWMTRSYECIPTYRNDPEQCPRG